MLTALGAVMAGSGDLQTAKLFRSIKSSYRLEITYGAQMASHMAMGLLYLGSGVCTLGTSNIAIASLFCSLFPIYPATVGDNRYHLQALRHLWVLAVEKRSLVTRNVTSDVVERVPIALHLKGGDIIKTFTPTMIPELSTIQEVEILGPRYWTYRAKLSHKNSKRPISIPVQRKLQHLSYTMDPDGKRGILGASFPPTHPNLSTEQIQRMREQFVRSFTSDPQVLSFIHYFCDTSMDSDPQALPMYSLRVLYECLLHDKQEMLKIYLWIYTCVKSLFNDRMDPGTMFNLKLLLRSTYHPRERQPLLNVEFVKLVEHQIHQFWKTKLQDDSNFRALLMQYVQTGSLQPAIGHDTDTIPLDLIASFMTWNDWPEATVLKNIHNILASTPNPLFVLPDLRKMHAGVTMTTLQHLIKTFGY